MLRSNTMKTIKTFDEKRGVGVLSGKPPSDVKLGPKRRAPRYYAGETYGRHLINYPDVERYPNGVIPGARSKPARRLIRGALKRRFSRVERALQLPRAMMVQARELVHDDHYDKSTSAQTRRARRLFAMELAIHTPVYAPSGKELRAIRTMKRKLKRQGKVDAITKMADWMLKP